uniref:uncharacterized protein LOC112435343 n=1 Tax=Maylandia zebra TaxID=106582 RepID=UPI000D321F64|nr:uncharacterized protein LOC112435343 [Maylandia zebra]
MKQLYTVPFERNSERVKELRRQYVQRVMELEANQAPHEFIYIDEAGFNLAKRRRRGRNVIGKRATVDVPGQRGANITMCAAIANAGLLLHRCQVGPYNTERLLAFLNDLHQRLVPEQGQEGENMRTFVITWDNVAFHHLQAITTWFEVHPRLVSLFLPPYSPFLNPIEEFFSAWRWKVYDHQPHDQMSLLEAMDAGSRDITDVTAAVLSICGRTCPPPKWCPRYYISFCPTTRFFGRPACLGDSRTMATQYTRSTHFIPLAVVSIAIFLHHKNYGAIPCTV